MGFRSGLTAVLLMASARRRSNREFERVREQASLELKLALARDATGHLLPSLSLALSF